MEKEDINILAQLLTSIEEATDRLENAERKKDAEEAASAKKAILGFQKEVDKLL